VQIIPLPQCKGCTGCPFRGSTHRCAKERCRLHNQCANRSPCSTCIQLETADLGLQAYLLGRACGESVSVFNTVISLSP